MARHDAPLKNLICMISGIHVASMKETERVAENDKEVDYATYR